MAEIRKIGVAEVEILQAICCETYYDTFIPSTSAEDVQHYLDTAYAIDVLTSELENPDSDYYFLYEDDEVVGYLKVNVGSAQTEDIDENTMEIQRIYVRPLYKRKGYGNLLMGQALKRAKERGVDSVWLGVWEHNDAAQAFYKSHGFVKVGEHIFKTGEQEDTDHILLKKLAKTISK